MWFALGFVLGIVACLTWPWVKTWFTTKFYQ